MTSAAVSAWTTSIKELQLLLDGGAKGPADRAARLRACKTTIRRLLDQPPLTRAVWKKLTQEVKVTRKVAALCVQAQLQQHTSPDVLCLTHLVLNRWLGRSADFLSPSPQSAPSSTYRQHLQASGLVQLLPATLKTAQEQLDAAAAALAAAGATGGAALLAAGPTGGAAAGHAAVSSSTSAGSTTADGAVVSPMTAFSTALQHAEVMLRNYITVCARLAPDPNLVLSAQAVVPATPAALSLVASVYRAGNAFLQAGDATPPSAELALLGMAFGAAHEAMGALATALHGGGGKVYEAFAQASGVHELLMSPELVRWFAVNMIATLLGLDTQAEPNNHSSSRRRTSVTVAGSSTERPRAAGSGVSLESLTPLSQSLFGLLGVDSATVLLAARHADLADLDVFGDLKNGYKVVLAYQVREAEGGRPVSGQLLLHLETFLLLSLCVQQLAAGIPASHTAAAAACAYVQTLECWPFIKLREVADLHRLPLAEPYTGPQLALQVWSSPLPPSQQQQQYVVAPTGALLSELLPLPTDWCLKRLDVLHNRRQAQQQQTALAGSRAELDSAAAAAVAAAASLVGGYAPAVSCPCIPCGPETTNATWLAMNGCLRHFEALLSSAIVPDPSVAIAASSARKRAAGGGGVGQAAAQLGAEDSEDAADTYSCVLHAQDVILPHAASILRVLEGLLRETAVQAAAAAPVAAGAGHVARMEAAQFAQIVVVEVISLGLHSLQVESGSIFSALVMAALAAGPGSQVQQQLFSLCASVLKVSDWEGLGAVVQHPGADVDFQEQLRCVAANVAVAVLASATPPLQPVGGAAAAPAAASTATAAAGVTAGTPTPGSAAAVQLLPCLVIMGRCCHVWAARQSLQEETPLNKWVSSKQAVLKAVKDILPAAQQWLESGDVSAQLAAAGYAPQPVVQLLAQAQGALEAFYTNVRNRQQFEAAFDTVVQHLQAAA